MKARIGVAAVCLAVLGCGPRGNALGLDGKYHGKLTYELISSEDPSDKYTFEDDGYVITVTRGQQVEIVGEMRIVPERQTRLIPYGCEPGGTASVDIRDGWRRELGIAPDAFGQIAVDSNC